ncbi:sensor domain-containing diguanylate cyclase [Geovibrio thiophilus]|uniref:diguanylate cyclase n=1 Tax=Geovibrio thiophilus TaxID=139438 RepID=A0A410JWU5_9BACT|nr:diguanylate cyclase [Geovibrio thiophilus]QAR32501.1 sensor domain-containing diguanylate cyclase [Geovibrio thiophilus]
MAVSVKPKLITILCLILFTGFLCVNLINYFSVKETMRENEIYGSLPLTRDNIYTEIQRDLMRPVFVSSLMAHDTFLKDWVLHGELSTGVVEKYLQEIKNKYGFFTAFFVSEKTGKYYYHGGVLKTVSEEDPHDVWYYGFKDLHKDYDIVIDENEAEENTLTVFINHRLNDYDNNLLGVTGVGLELQRITNLLSAYQVKYDRDIYLVDRTGDVQMYPGGKSLADNIYKEEGLKDVAKDALTVSEASGFYEYKRGGDDIFLTVRYIEELDWFLFVENNQSKPLEGLRKNLWQNMFLGFFVSILVILINIFTVNFFQSRLEKMASTDELTGLLNRRAFENEFRRAESFADRNGTVFSIILFDLDGFKAINDTCGHSTGDEILKKVTLTAAEKIRQVDVFARWGGDEFIILAYGGEEIAAAIAERIRCGIDIISCGGAPKITASCGVAKYIPGENMDSLIKRADEALYLAKKSGRNRVSTCV